ncbi:MAG TPA: glycoside hydrolase family 2 TIM barrel-domain containing protein [Bacteroidales bacterium]|nr:glycoside hydrolase family 2 TIM barrel-domain containing protein [Bacteroidales bacterium]
MKFKNLSLICVILLAGFLASCRPGDLPVLEPENFNHDWMFYRAEGIPDLPPSDAQWEKVDLPHTAHIEPLVIIDQWQGISFYKKEFGLREEHKGKELFIKFEAAMNVAEVWVNDTKMITNMNGWLPFLVNITQLARFDEQNNILVRLDNRDNPITGPKPLEILDFNMFGGIYRNAWLIAKNPVHITDPTYANVVAGGGVFFANLSANADSAAFEIKTHVRNASDQSSIIRVEHRLVDSDGGLVATLRSDRIDLEAGKDAELVQNHVLLNPRLWSPNHPNLYSLETRLYADGRLSDVYATRVGLREIRITNEGMWLNGEQIVLRGVNRHQEYPFVGYAMSDAAQFRDAYKIKHAGFDLVRASHYPMSPAFMRACDELGIFVLNAIMGWQYFGEDEKFAQLALEQCRRLIRRDRNHASVLAWELSLNETYMPVWFTEKAHAIGREEFPYPGSYTAGWVRHPYDIYLEARQHRHGLFPELPLFVSEYGDWEYYAQNAGLTQHEWRNLLPYERNSRQARDAGEKRLLQQAFNIQEAHNDNRATHAFADAFWVMFDYNRGMGHNHVHSGVMDIFRLPKFTWWFYKSQRTFSQDNPFSKPVLFIASHWQPGVSRGVRIFSNADEVELIVDGVSKGRQKPTITSFSENLLHPPFEFKVNCTTPGTITAKGFIDGQEVATHSITTPGAPAKITLEVDYSGKPPQKGANDVLFVYAHVLDANDNPVFGAANPVEFLIEGDAEIIGGNIPKAVAGIATILLRIGRTGGAITLQARGEGLQEATYTMNVE